jgi:AbrB family looped-hinge helix DNA binding protein
MKVGERGQITIPKAIREKYGFFPKMEVEFIPLKDGVKLKKRSSRTSPVREVFGILKSKTRTDDYMEDVRGR